MPVADEKDLEPIRRAKQTWESHTVQRNRERLVGRHLTVTVAVPSRGARQVVRASKKGNSEVRFLVRTTATAQFSIEASLGAC